MKKIILFLTTIVVLNVGCKKEEKAPDVPEPQPIVKIISLKINAEEKSCTNTCFSASTSGGLRGLSLYLSGINEYLYFSCTNLPAPGTYTLVKYGKPFLMYSKDNANRPAASGTINITAIDTTAHGVLNKLSATFSFKTDTSSNGTTYNITDGIINLKN